MRVLLLVVLLAGCTSEGSGARADDFYINLEGTGDWVVHLPVPEDAVFGLKTWRDTMRVSTGQATIVWDTDRLPLAVHGNGSVRLEALARVDQPGCCLMDYRDALWSSGAATQGLPVEVEEGAIAVHIDHNVVVCRSGCGEGEVPRVCTQRVNVQSSDLEVGRHTMAIDHIGRTC